MYDIYSIMDMLDWNNNEDVQKEGIQLSKDIDSIREFFQPSSERYNKNVWGNCAKVISSRTDEELNPYLSLMFEWLQDMNWPGAFTIYDRLMNMELRLIHQTFLECLNSANIINDDIWEMWLMTFAKEYDMRYGTTISKTRQSGDGSVIDG